MSTGGSETTLCTALASGQLREVRPCEFIHIDREAKVPRGQLAVHFRPTGLESASSPQHRGRSTGSIILESIQMSLAESLSSRNVGLRSEIQMRAAQAVIMCVEVGGSLDLQSASALEDAT